MAKIDILNLTDGYRCAPEENIDVEFNYKYLNEEESSTTVKLYISDDKEFTSPTIISVGNIYIYNSGSYTLHNSRGVINTSAVPGQFKFSFQFPNINDVRYIKIAIIGNTATYFSSPILLTSNNTLDFKTLPLILQNRPNKVKIDDKKKLISGSNVTINVFVTNNALDESPVWENITAYYLTNQFYEFTNDQKTATNWAISVRYLITKTSYNAGFEIEEIYISHV